jgi:hypothetical protein
MWHSVEVTVTVTPQAGRGLSDRTVAASDRHGVTVAGHDHDVRRSTRGQSLSARDGGRAPPGPARGAGPGPGVPGASAPATRVTATQGPEWTWRTSSRPLVPGPNAGTARGGRPRHRRDRLAALRRAPGRPVGMWRREFITA